MKILACFLLCSMMGGASEVLFGAARNSIKSRFGRAVRGLPDSSAPTLAQTTIETDGMHVSEQNAAGLKSGQA